MIEDLKALAEKWISSERGCGQDFCYCHRTCAAELLTVIKLMQRDDLITASELPGNYDETVKDLF